MDINPKNFLSIKEALADVTVALNDEAMKMLTPGFYNSQVKYALDELGFDIGFLKVTNDFPMPVDLILEMPKGCFNLNGIHIFTGTPDNVGYVENVYWKKGAQTRGAGTGYTADSHMWNATDPFFKISADNGSLYYFSVQNGLIRLSDACSGFAYARLTFNGIPSGNLDEVAMLPPEIRKAVVLWTTEKCASYLKMRDSKYRTVQLDAASQLDEYGLNGAWHEAKMRLAKLDMKMLKDAIEYNSRLNF